jgi:methylphosphotriester-DNA--protein-cysteine methyltransferase
VIWIIEKLEPNYWGDYVSNEKTAGAVANDLDRAIEERAKGNATEARLREISQEFRRLKYLRDKLLHATPIVASDGRRLHHIARDIAWNLDEVRKAATDFATAAESAHAMFREL